MGIGLEAERRCHNQETLLHREDDLQHKAEIKGDQRCSTW